MYNKQILLYGIGGPDKAYGVLGFWCIYEQDFSATEIRRQAVMLKAKNPSIKQVFVIDNRRGLRKEFQESQRLNSIESKMIFKDILEREGWEFKDF